MGVYTRKVKTKNLTSAQGSRYERAKAKKTGKATNSHYRIKTQKKVDNLNTLRTK